MATDVPGAITGNLHTSARHLVGQRASSWLNTLKDVKDRVQSVTPALPRLLPNTILETNIINGAKNQYSINNYLAESLVARDKGKELQEESNHCEYDQPADTVSAQLPVCTSVCNDSNDLCHKAATSESRELPSELSSRPGVGNLSVSGLPYDENSVASVTPDANQSSILGEHYDLFHAVNTVDCVQHESTFQSTSSHEGEQNLPSDEGEVHPSVAPQSAALNAPTEVRTFSSCVDDCPEIIFASTRKRMKPAKHGIDKSLMFICMQDTVWCYFVDHPHSKWYMPSVESVYPPSCSFVISTLPIF